MMKKATIALVGDLDPTVTAHQAIPKALALAGAAVKADVQFAWLPTRDIYPDLDAIRRFSGFWSVPASPYENADGVLDVITFARTAGRPFLGTCGGYQHAILEYARNVLGHAEAGHSELDPDCAMPLLSTLACALVEVDGDIYFTKGSKLEAIFDGDRSREAYHCSYGINPDYVSLFDGSKLCFTGKDRTGEPRAFELAGHPFFVGTAFQPERLALAGQAHRLIETFVAASAQEMALA